MRYLIRFLLIVSTILLLDSTLAEKEDVDIQLYVIGYDIPKGSSSETVLKGRIEDMGGQFIIGGDAGDDLGAAFEDVEKRIKYKMMPYLKNITIKENSGNILNDYQVLVQLNADNFPDKAEMNGSDLRFYDSNETALEYWIENWNNDTKYAKIWVKVPTIPASGLTKIKMGYGDPYASSQSDGARTFEFFDDFDDESIDPSK